MKSSSNRVLYIDPKDQHLTEENIFAIHPNKINWLASMQKETFDKAVIQNVPSAGLTSIGFFNISQTIKQGGVVEVYVSQPISVMQSLDASEIEANAKLAGFVDIKQSEYEKFVKDGEKDVKFSTIKVTMVRQEKVVSK